MYKEVQKYVKMQRIFFFRYQVRHTETKIVALFLSFFHQGKVKLHNLNGKQLAHI
jgi:hypothetical protein